MDVEKTARYAGDPRKPEFLKLNPKGFVAVLLTERGPISENAAIMAYVAQAYPEAKLAKSENHHILYMGF